MSRRAPAVLVSSTFYDLHQLRSDLAVFISGELGYRALLSELPSFPVDPDADTIENCRRRVQEDADLLVLVVGGRYGSIDSPSAKSITNIEYLAARANGIPLFVFIDRAVLSVLPVWKDNPSANFAGVIDDVRVFTFIQEMRDVHKVWTHDFATAQDIIATLRVQLSYLMQEGLELRHKFIGVDPRSRLNRLHGDSFRVALEKPRGWEYLLFANVLRDEISSASDLRRDYDLELSLGLSDYVTLEQLASWTAPRIAELEAVVKALNILLNQSLKAAFGAPGEPGNVDEIVFVAERIGASYRRAIEWTQQVRRSAVDDELRPVLKEMANLSRDIVEKLETFSTELLERVTEALASPPGTRQEIEMTLRLTIPDGTVERCIAAIDAIRRRRMGQTS